MRRARDGNHEALGRQPRFQMMSDPQTSPKIGAAGWTAIVVLLAFLAVAVAYAIHGWSRVGAVGIPPIGWAFLIAGIVLTLLVGGGLMALIFYSRRKGRDI